MYNEILHSESLNISQTTKQWVISIVLLIDLTVLSLLIYFYHNGIIPNKNFDKNALIAIPVILIIISIFTISIVLLSGFSFKIYEDSIVIKSNVEKERCITKKEIKEYHRISKKEYYKLVGYKRHNSKKMKRKRIKQYVIRMPNYLIMLNSGEKILIQTKRKSSFEYSMNKMLDIRYE